MAQYFNYKSKQIGVGDTVRVHQEIVEGDKKRIQVFEGIVIAIKNHGLGQSFTVRKIASGGVGVEKIYPVHMPGIAKIEVKRKGNVRRAKLYYLRERVGKRATKVKEKARATASVAAKPEEKAATTEAKAVESKKTVAKTAKKSSSKTGTKGRAKSSKAASK